MMLFQSAAALELTGLTRSQLREWTGRGRRELVPPDVEPEGPGRHALYAWQTLLVLRILRVLHEDFAAEVGAWAPAALALRRQLEGSSFPTLWHLSVLFPNREAAQLIEDAREISGPGIVVPLDPHLLVLATKLSLAKPRQLSLFPALMVSR
jgi:hypothetical protein